MQTHINMNVTLRETFEFLNSTTNVTTSTSVEETYKLKYREIARWIHMIVRPIIIVIGTTGNCLSFYIMRRTSLKNVSSCFYMSMLALADTSKWTLILIC